MLMMKMKKMMVLIALSSHSKGKDMDMMKDHEAYGENWNPGLPLPLTSLVTWGIHLRSLCLSFLI